MEFWRVYRLAYARRWLLAAMMTVAVMVVFVGTSLKAQQKRFTAEALLQPQDVAPQVLSGAGTGGDLAGVAGNDRVSRISDLIMLLRSSNDLYLQAAHLLRKNEADRAKEVQRILTRNGYFASLDKEAETQAAQAVARGELSTAAAEKLVRQSKAFSRRNAVASLAQAHDDLGTFAVTGISSPDNEIVQRIRSSMTFDTVAGPLSNENSQQIVNQIKVTGTAEREAEADLYVNMVCVAFLDYFPQLSAGKRNAQIAQLTELRRTAKERLDKAVAGEIKFRNEKRSAITLAPEDTIRQLSALRTQKGQAEQDRETARAAVAVAESELAAVKQAVTTALPTDENPDVRRAQGFVDTARINFDAVIASNAGEESDSYKTAKAALDSARSRLEEARQRPYNQTLPNNNQATLQLKVAENRGLFAAADRRVAELNRQIGEQETLVKTLPAVNARLNELVGARQRSEKDYNDIDSRLKQTELSSVTDGQSGIVSIVSQAHTTLVGGDIASQRGRLMLYGAVLALLFGLGMVVGLDALDNTMRGASDVEKLLGLPVVAILPAQFPDPSRAPRITYVDPLSPEAEAYRMLRTELLFTNVQHPFQSLMTTTGKPGQGASTTISNLAITLAQSGKRVILVDADLRYPKLHNIYRLRNEVGLSTILNREVALDEALQTTEVENLRLLSAGPVVANPSELLGSWEMHTLHEELKKRADFVLFDTPSAIAFSDAALLASFIDRVLMVVRSSNVPRGSEERVLALLNKAGANIVGVALNDVPSEKVDSVHYHRNYYPVLAPGSTNSAYNPYENTGGTNSSAPAQISILPVVVVPPHQATASSEPSRETLPPDIEKTQEMFVVPPRPPVVSPTTPPVYMSLVNSPIHHAPQTRPRVAWKTYLLGAGVAVIVGGLVLALVAGAGVR